MSSLYLATQELFIPIMEVILSTVLSEKYYKKRGIIYYTGPISNPSSTGLLEKAVQGLVTHLMTNCIERGIYWQLFFTFARRCTICKTRKMPEIHGYASAEIILGFTPLLIHFRHFGGSSSWEELRQPLCLLPARTFLRHVTMSGQSGQYWNFWKIRRWAAEREQGRERESWSGRKKGETKLWRGSPKSCKCGEKTQAMYMYIKNRGRSVITHRVPCRHQTWRKKNIEPVIY